MNTQAFSRPLYRLMLRLHPSAFRRRFGDEMLWIFDLASNRKDAFYLLLDGARSLAVQRAKVDMQEEAVSPFGMEIQLSGFTAGRVGQAAVIGTAILLALASLLARQMPSQIDHGVESVCGRDDGPNAKVLLELRR
jgi:hypothetical protein